MLDRLIRPRLIRSAKSLLLLGPRQVGKSTLCRSLHPDCIINLADEEEFLRFSRDPGLLRRILEAREGNSPTLVFLDEIQRIPALLNTVQAMLDERRDLRFLITGSSARKLKRGEVNLLPGRILLEHLDPLSLLEVKGDFDLSRALRLGMLPGVHLDEIEGTAILDSYTRVYLREEIRAEALARNLGGFVRFLDTAGLVSGSWINYSKLAVDAEIPKETVRRFFGLLEDTLLVFRLPSYRPSRSTTRKLSQRDRFLFFDIGVRNALLGLHRRDPTPDQIGSLFEQWMIGQIRTVQRALAKDWSLSSYRTAGGAEVDLVIETPERTIGVEIKSSRQVTSSDCRGLRSLAEIVPRERLFRGYLVYWGKEVQVLRHGTEEGIRAFPYRRFIEHLAQSPGDGTL